MDIELHSWAHFSVWLIGINFDSKDDYVTHVKKAVYTYTNMWIRFLEFANLQDLADERMVVSGIFSSKL